MGLEGVKWQEWWNLGNLGCGGSAGRGLGGILMGWAGRMDGGRNGSALGVGQGGGGGYWVGLVSRRIG